MGKKSNTKEKIKKAWNWVWHSDSILSWIVALIIIYLIVKYIFFPGLSLIMGTSLPLAGIESPSMDHQITKDESNKILTLCGNVYPKSEKHHVDFNEYWQTCGDWYREKEITKQDFLEFPLKNGFRKGDIVLVWGRFEPKVGDVIIFKPNSDSNAPRPIIHRIVKIEDEIIETKGDHNEKQLIPSNNPYRTDETKIYPEQIVGKAIMKIPYLGWPKIWVTELISMFR